MKKISLILIILVITGLFLPVVSAKDIVLIDTELYDPRVISPSMTGSTAWAGTYTTDQKLWREITAQNGYDLQNLNYMIYSVNCDNGFFNNGTSIPSGRYEIPYTCYNYVGGYRQPAFYSDTAIIYIQKTKNLVGSVTSTTITIFLTGIDEGIIGYEYGMVEICFSDFYFDSSASTAKERASNSFTTDLKIIPGFRKNDNTVYSYKYPFSFKYVKILDWKNHLHVKICDDTLIHVNISREFGDVISRSEIKFINDISSVIKSDIDVTDKIFLFEQSQNLKIINVTAYFSSTQTGKTWSFDLGDLSTIIPIPGAPTNKTFTAFIRDGTTYEPISFAEIAFKSYDTGQWVINKTVTGGSTTITLPMGWYYAYITAPGYYQPVPVQMVVDESLTISTFNIYSIGDIPEPEEPTEFLDLIVSVKNSQTGALIGGSEIGIRRYGDTGFYQNLTLSSGYTTVFLPPANYEIFAEAPGYYQVYPARITLDEPHENIGVFLQPTSPAPSAGNVTLNLWVCYVEHGSGQTVGISYADILISGISGDGIGYSSGSLITDMGGYLTLDIPANTEYIAYAEKPGYLAGTTHFTVYNVSPVNMTIQMIREIPPTVPVVTPPPTIPTLPTPTEPLGFMEQSGKALGDLFGVSLSTGKMMLGVLISLAVGMGTAKNLKGGAPEFCVGFLGAAFLFTMADLIPVGFFVAMLLLMGIYIARAYFLGGENGR